MIEFIHDKGLRNLIIFVHGFTGDNRTWLNTQKTSFPNMILDENEINNNFDVAYFNYYTKLISLPKLNLAKRLFQSFWSKKLTMKNIDIIELGEFLKSEIHYKCSKYDSIIIIAHSMGGLVAKSYILSEYETDKLSKVKLFLSLAVPHNGSDWASYGQVIFNNIQISDLKPLSKTIVSLNSKWIKLGTNAPKTVYFYGQHDDAVKKESAVAYDVDKQTTVSCDDNHISIAKPEKKDKINYVAVRKHLIDFINDNNLQHNLEVKEFIDQGQLDEQLFVIKLLIADVHNTLIRGAKETFFNAEYMRKYITRYGPQMMDKLSSLYVKIKLLYNNDFITLASNSNALVSTLHKNIIDHDDGFLQCEISMINAFHKTGMLHQLANQLEHEIWWSLNSNSVADIESFRKAAKTRNE